MYDLRVHDKDEGLMLDAVTMADLMSHPDIDERPIFDAMVVQVARMQTKMEMLQKVMEAAGSAVKPTAVTISDPVRSRGVMQVMVLFEMSDGQTVSVWFHNPDTTPAKLTPMDDLISWKWMLNKKDVTIVVAPERGKDLNIREVARRVMRLIERNTEAFKKANAKAAERIASMEALKTEIADLETQLTKVNRQIEVAEMQADDLAKVVSLDLKGFAKFDLPGGVVQLEHRKLGEPVMNFAIHPKDGKYQAQYGNTSNKSILLPSAQAGIDWAAEFRDEVVAAQSINYGAKTKTPKSDAVIATLNELGAIYLTQLTNLIAEKAADPLMQNISAEINKALVLAKKADSQKNRAQPKQDAPFAESYQKEVDALNSAMDVVRATTGSNPFKPEQIKVAQNDPVNIVDLAYQFDGSDEFKRYVADSINENSYSPFASAKAIDQKAHDLGAKVRWDVTTALLDGVDANGFQSDKDADDDNDFDPQAEFDATPELDDGDKEIEAVLDGDFAGHPFRGNQYKQASNESGSAVKSSMRAKHAERKGDTKAAAKAHETAHYSHKAAAVSAKGKAKSYHAKMAKFHGSRSGKPVMDAVLDDASDLPASAIGVIKKVGKIQGRAFIGGDGKAMIYVGAKGNTRVTWDHNGERRPFMWSDDDVVDMVVELLAIKDGQTAEVKKYAPDVVSVYSTQAGKEGAVIKRTEVAGKVLWSYTGEWGAASKSYEDILADVQEFKRTKRGMKLAYGAELSELNPSDPKAEIPTSKNDITYRAGDMFTTFYPDSKAGEDAWKVINATEGAEGGKVLNQHAESTIAQLREAGYTVNVASPVSDVDEDALLKALDIPAEPASAADAAYLQSLIDGTADMFAADVFERLEPMFAKYEGDTDMTAMLNKAAEAYSSAAVKAAQSALAA